MEPEVRYCTKPDGVRVAYTVVGSGPVHVICTDPTASHVKLTWEHPVLGALMHEFARQNTLVSFDFHGSGLSDRVRAGKLDDYVSDLEAVVGRLQLPPFALSGIQAGAPAAIAYAARHPELVRRMVFIDGYARMADVLNTPPVRALVAAAENDWEMATEAIGALVFGPGRAESRVHGQFIRACTSQDNFTRSAEVARIDASSLLDQVSAATLVLHHTGVRYVTDQMTRELVSRIPDARLLTLEGLWGEDPEGLAKRVVDFVNAGVEQPAAVSSAAPSGVRTVLFTDLVNHTEMIRRLGDARGRQVLREHEQIARETISAHGGTVVKTDGDSFMVSFGSVTSAMECAVAMQRAFAARNETADEPLRVRMGLNAGEPIEDGGDLFGEAVILASRIAARANEGEILIAEPVRHLLAGKGFLFADRGEFVPKGFEDTVRLFEVRWQT